MLSIFADFFRQQEHVFCRIFSPPPPLYNGEGGGNYPPPSTTHLYNVGAGPIIRKVSLSSHTFTESSLGSRVRPFRLKFFFAYKRNKAKLDPFHMCFTISL
jgi:hypothetical protein